MVAMMAKLIPMLTAARIGATVLPVPAAGIPEAGSARYPRTMLAIWAGIRKMDARKKARRIPGATCVSSITRRFNTAFPAPLPKRPSRIV